VVTYQVSRAREERSPEGALADGQAQGRTPEETLDRCDE
jgi:hypothetical protein